MSTFINYSAEEISGRGSKSYLSVARVSFLSAAFALFYLVLLHILSPEFDPSWRMVSEYALGQYGWVLTLFFISWAVSSLALFFTVRKQVKTVGGKIGLGFLIAAGIGQAMASVFDVTQETLHGLAAMIGIPSLPVAAILISVSLTRNPSWSFSRKRLLWTAGLTWFSIVLMTVTIIIMMNGLKEAGISADAKIKTLPPGVVALAGWANRLLIILYCVWTITIARTAMRVDKIQE